MTPEIPADVHVLVVGADPTGLMLANQLMRCGLRLLIIDRHAGPARETRAPGVQARTLKIYARRGVVERALELGKQGNGANMWADGKRMARVPLGDAGKHLTPYPYILVLGQDDNERILGDRLRQQGLEVQWNCELVGLEQASDHVVATLTGRDGRTRQLRAAWVAGCDGARSVVRERSGIGFPGAPYEHAFFVADVQMTGTMVQNEVNVYLWQEGFPLLFPMRGDRHWRIVGILPPALCHDGVRFDDLLPSIREAVLPPRRQDWRDLPSLEEQKACRGILDLPAAGREPDAVRGRRPGPMVPGDQGRAGEPVLAGRFASQVGVQPVRGGYGDFRIHEELQIHHPQQRERVGQGGKPCRQRQGLAGAGGRRDDRPDQGCGRLTPFTGLRSFRPGLHAV